jgi:membrane fusion protein, macrolide-specific efflux system
MQQKFRHKLAILICLFVMPIVATGCSNSNSSASAIETGIVSEASVTNTIETSGSVTAKQLVTLSWAISGTVEQVAVQNNDTVKSGAELMSLDSKTAPSTVNKAISDLITAKQNLTNIQQSTTDLAKAEVALNDAKIAYNKALLAYNSLNQPVGSAEYIAILQKNYLNAQAQTKRALGTYNGYADYLETSSQRANALAALSKARIAENDALITLNHFSNPPDAVEAALITSDYNLAKSQLDEAQKAYDAVSDGNIDAINEAQAAVNSAQSTVNKLKITAPIDGQVAVVYSQPGDMVSSGTKAIVLYDRSEMFIDVLVTEDLISSVKIGNPASISFSGLKIETTGKVTLIDPIGASSSGVVNYTVRVKLDKPDPQIYIGATATVIITTSDPQNKLFVPVAAVLNDNQGEYVMRVKNDGSTERVQVVTGDISNETVVVTGDLTKNDLVELFTSSTTESSTTTNQNRGGLFGGIGGIFR